MRSLLRPIGLATALVATALVGGGLIGAALAAPATSTTASASTATELAAPASAPTTVAAPVTAPAAALDGTYCRTYRAAFAAELGVPESALAPAGKAAAVATVDAAVVAGDLTQAQAVKITARIAAIDGDACSRLIDRIADRLDRASRPRQP